MTLRIRQAGGNPLLLRPGTTDAMVLWDTFYHKYHLPPMKLRPNCIIVDLGANVGYTTAHFAFLYPKAHVIAVEMDKGNFGLARRNLEFFYPRCDLINAAIWEEDGEVAYEGEEEWGFRVVGDADALGPYAKMAPARTIEGIFEEFHLRMVDYLKMDIEGAEAVVLQDNVSWTDNVRSMKIEVHPRFHPDATFARCRRILTAKGFHCERDDRYGDYLVATK